MKGFRIAFALAVLATTPAGAYYHFLHYSSSGAAIPEKYNLAQLPLSTVSFFVSDAGPASYIANDSFPSVVNQIRQATQIWNDVQTSALRVSFGGLYTAGTPDNSPGGLVVFEALPPGVLAYSGPTSCEDTTPNGPTACQSQVPGPSDSYLPILQSTMHISQDLTRLPGPSYSETFFLVSVHEMGHALGLQHTFTSSTMSTITTRATSLRNPLGADDIAGISELYPTASFAAQFGSISGSIQYAGSNSPVHMASVVAFSNAAPSVSALTLVDGSFQINGLQPGQYSLYVHPIPPTADIVPPVDPSANSIGPSGPFDAIIFPGVPAPLSAALINVTAGQVSSGNKFFVSPRADIPIYDVAMYSYFPPNVANANPVHPAYVSASSSTYTSIVADGVGLTSNGTPAPGLTVQSLNPATSIYGQTAYVDSSGNTDLQLFVQFSSSGSLGPQHLLCTLGDYQYLLPSAFNDTANGPPTIASVTNNSGGTVTVAGTQFIADTAVYFDSLPGVVQSRDLTNGLITLVPPLGASSQISTLTAFNSDGQNSMFLQTGNPPTFSYPAVAPASLSFNPAMLPAGSSGMVTITGVNTNFTPGLTSFGFGTHDAEVLQTFVVSPTQAIVDINIPSGGASPLTSASALTGFQLVEAPQSFQISSLQSGIPVPFPILFNGVQGQSGSFPGAVMSLYGSDLQASASASPTVTIGGEPAALLYASPNLINLQIPSNLSPGLVQIVVNNAATNSFPSTVNIDPPEPVILNIQAGPAQLVNVANSATPGESIDAFLSGFPNPGSIIDPSRVQISVGGITQPAAAVTEVGTSAIYDVNWILASAIQPGSSVPVIVYIDSRSSVPANISISAAVTSSSN